MRRPIIQIAILCGALAGHWAEAGRCSNLVKAAKDFFARQSLPKGVVATYDYQGLHFEFGDEDNPDRILIGKVKPIELYRGRVTRIPLFPPRRLREPGVFWPPHYLKPEGRVPRAVSSRVTGFWDLYDAESSYVLTISTEDGVLIVSSLYRDFLAGYGIRGHKTKKTTFFVPSRQQFVALASMRSVGKSFYTGDAPTLYPCEFVMIALVDALTSKNFFLADEVYDLPLLQPQGEGGSYSYEVPQGNRQTWLVRADGEYHNIADPKETFELYQYGGEGLYVGSEDYTVAARAEFSHNTLTLVPRGNGAIFLSNPGWEAPLTVDLDPSKWHRKASNNSRRYLPN